MKVSAPLLLLVASVLSACGSAAQPSREAASVDAGRQVALNRCSRCHGIGRVDESPLEQAPPFRRIQERYPVDHLAEALAEGIVVGHAEMPAIELQPDEITALISYLKSLGHKR